MKIENRNQIVDYGLSTVITINNSNNNDDADDNDIWHTQLQCHNKFLWQYPLFWMSKGFALNMPQIIIDTKYGSLQKSIWEILKIS